MDLFKEIFPYLVGLAVLAVVIVLLAGFVSMGKGGEFNEKYGNKLMRLRVITQGVAVGLMLVGWLLWHGH
jgi:hypothetical protein